ncbi:unnamed protein product [Macrosiphum euphorbiae]|uniref:MULE transposase domain-containing protein n=1 Tax=Macrosiphum euphorbiae TaxID=13131 RepID=A0AAV0WH77_9HEMI|nr:unnamed protein product [Macrosiphum euphorbiae]
MEKKTAEAYDAALHYVKHYLLPEFRPTVFLTDFEAALRIELIRHFPTSAAHGCWFHINQTVLSKMKKLGFLNLIITNESSLKTFKLIMVIPLLPAQQIEELFIYA